MSPTRTAFASLLLAATAVPIGCNQPARVVTDDRDKIVSVDQLDVQN